jgi:two-component system sensor histidine kinase BaeS
MWRNCAGNKEISGKADFHLVQREAGMLKELQDPRNDPGYDTMKLSLTYKFFLSLLGAAGVVAVGMYFFMQNSFGRGFLQYVNTVEMARFDTLAANLETAYSEHGNWDFLRANYRLWRRFLDDTLPADARPPRRPFGAGAGRVSGQPPPPAPMQPGMAGVRPPPAANPELAQLFGHRVVLMDKDRNTLFGPPDHPPDMVVKTLEHEGVAIGYAGLIPQQHIVNDLQLRYVREQKKTFGFIALAMACIAALIALPLARQMVKRIKVLAAATHQMAAGCYDTRLEAGGSDELARLTHDFNSLARTLARNEELRGQWMGDISHELRTPLAVLRGEIEALQDNVRAPTPETFNSLHGEVMRLGRLVDDLFLLSMSDIGALTYRKKELDLVPLLEDAVEQFQHEFQAGEIAVNMEAGPDRAVKIFGDPDRLQQLFDNLLSNSLKYTDTGGCLQISLGAADGWATIIWQDSSPGVAAAEINRLFERFYRVEGSRSRTTGGVGLGLAICRNIVEAHDGVIAAEPSELGGVLIRVRLPLAGGK